MTNRTKATDVTPQITEEINKLKEIILELEEKILSLEQEIDEKNYSEWEESMGWDI